MPIIDSQVHVYEANTPARPWATVPNWPPQVNGEDMVAAMDAAAPPTTPVTTGAAATSRRRPARA